MGSLCFPRIGAYPLPNSALRLNVTSINEFIKSAKAIMYVVIDTLTRSRSGLGL
jgi:hypothetical protein